MHEEIAERMCIYLSKKKVKKCKFARLLEKEPKTIYNQLGGACEVSLELILGILKLFPDLNPRYILFGDKDMECSIDTKAKETIDELKVENRVLEAQVKMLQSLIKQK